MLIIKFVWITNLYLIPQPLDFFDVLQPLGVRVKKDDGLETRELGLVHFDVCQRSDEFV